MHDFATPSQPGAHNAFAPVFLDTFAQRDEPSSAAEADLEGPWEVRHIPSPRPGARFALWRRRAQARRGDHPVAEFGEESTAILACALRPLCGRDPLYALGFDREEAGFPLVRDGEPAGWIELFEEGWVAGINLLERVVRSPEALALVMEAAGPLALDRAGRILHDRVLPDEPEEPVQ